MDINQNWLFRLRLRNLIRSASGLLPRSLRFAIHRNLINLDLEPDRRLRFKVAETQEELTSAFTILHDEYVRAEFMQPQPSGMRVTLYHALPSTSTLVALWDNQVVATVSVVRDSAFGFPLDKIFQTEDLRRYGARLAEVSALAIRKEFRQNRGMVLYPLIKYVIEYCRKYFGVDYMVIAVNPRHIEFYESILGFERFPGPIQTYDFVNGAPAVGAYIATRDFYKRLVTAYGTKHPHKNMFHYLMELELPNFEYPDRTYFKVSDPILTPELLDYFFNQRTQLFASLSDREISIISALYDCERYAAVLPPCASTKPVLHKRKATRFDVSCQGQVLASATRQVRMEVKNVSETGFQAYLAESIRFGFAVEMRIVIAEFDVAQLKGWPTWVNSEGVYGFHIESASPNWSEFIDHLSKDMIREQSIEPKVQSRA